MNAWNHRTIQSGVWQRAIAVRILHSSNSSNSRNRTNTSWKQQQHVVGMYVVLVQSICFRLLLIFGSTQPSRLWQSSIGLNKWVLHKILQLSSSWWSTRLRQIGRNRVSYENTYIFSTLHRTQTRWYAYRHIYIASDALFIRQTISQLIIIKILIKIKVLRNVANRPTGKNVRREHFSLPVFFSVLFLLVIFAFAIRWAQNGCWMADVWTVLYWYLVYDAMSSHFRSGRWLTFDRDSLHCK